VSPAGDGDLLARLLTAVRDKAKRMETAGTQCLCVENYTGIFAFTEWGWSPMPRKIALLEDAIRNALPERPIDGVVVCSGVSHFNGVVNEEIAETSTGSVGLRYAVTPWRAREALVVPIRDSDRTPIWREVFQAEAQWLPWALAECGLPPLEMILPG
jgi:hypothetical protein